MMAKFTVLLFFFASSLLLENFATEGRNVDVDHLAATIVPQIMTHFFSTFEPSGRNHSNAEKWMSFVLEKASDESTAEHDALIAKIATSIDMTLTLELVSLADGFHLVIPNGEREVENERRIEAIAIVNMLMNLKTMERMDTILANCSLATTVNVLLIKGNNESPTTYKEKFANTGQEYIGRLFVDWLRSITAVLESDPHLNEEFIESKDEARKEILATGYASEVSSILEMVSLQNEDVSAMSRKLAEKMLSSHLFRRMLLNREFLRAATKQSLHKTGDGKGQFLLARALLDLACQHGEDERVNEIYRKTLFRVPESVFSEAKITVETRDKFFDALKKEIVEADVDLAKRLQLIESKLDIWIVFRALRRSVAFV